MLIARGNARELRLKLRQADLEDKNREMGERGLI
jgi:hypothetical protein